jgi:hypothetical protein
MSTCRFENDEQAQMHSSNQSRTDPDFSPLTPNSTEPLNVCPVHSGAHVLTFFAGRSLLSRRKAYPNPTCEGLTSSRQSSSIFCYNKTDYQRQIRGWKRSPCQHNTFPRLVRLARREFAFALRRRPAGCKDGGTCLLCFLRTG